MLVSRLDAVVLTANDLPTMKEGVYAPSRRIGGIVKDPPVVDGFSHGWDGDQPEENVTVRYWLFGSVADTQKAAAEWYPYLGAEAFYKPEPNTEDVIGDATWRIPNRSSLWFVKNNVLVYIIAGNPKVNQLSVTRAVARKIVAKINAVLNPL